MPTTPATRNPTTSARLPLITAFAVAFLLGMSMAVAATHPQSVTVGERSFGMQFDHDGDNEWWVEVLVRGISGDNAITVEARIESGTWQHLENVGRAGDWQKWGTDYPHGQFRIPVGERVQFRAMVLDAASGDAAFVESCPFTHPAGVESCGAIPPPPPPPPPSAWTATPIGTAGTASSSGDMAVSDADNDGIRDVTVGNPYGVHFFEKNDGTWTQGRLSTLTGFSALAAGDGDGDARREIYAMSNNNLVQYSFTAGVGWSERILLTLPGRVAGDMTLGDIDSLPGPEIYVGMVDIVCPDTHPCRSESGVYHIRFTDGLVWESRKIASLSGSVDSMWIGNADNNGRTELYVGHGAVDADRDSKVLSQVQFVMGTWAVTDLPGTGSHSGFSLVVAGDGNRDASQEVYTLNYEGWLRMVTFDQANGWSANDIFTELRTPEGAHLQARTLFLGDGDGDGSQELYIGTELGQIYQVRWDGSAWVAKRIANPVDDARGVNGSSALMVIGDADMDGRSEIYAAIGFTTHSPSDSGVTRVYQIKAAPPPGTFDATFTGVRGNEWWVQANVATNGATVTKVEAILFDQHGSTAWPMARQSWGATAWATSQHMPEGTIVRLRATASTGETDISDCYRWIPSSNTDAGKVSCTPPPPLPPPSGFDASFTGVKGNEWWVQATVSGNQPIAKVEARVNCGSTWIALTNEGWGWAKSFHVPNGSKVDFRATSTGGATDFSGGYTWPQANAAPAC